MASLRVQLLGGLVISEGDHPLPALPTEKSKLLFAYLLTHRKSSQPREVLAELFWGDLGADKARNNLRYVLSVLRRALEAYRGDFLHGFYEDWVFAEQERLKQLYLEAVETLALWPGGPFVGSPPLRKSEEAGLKLDLARAQMRVYHLENALVFSEQALDLYQQSQDPLGQGQAYLLLGVLHRQLGQNEKASKSYHRALALSSLGDARTQVRVLNSLGWLQWNLHHPRKALDYYEQGLAICRHLGDRRTKAIILDNWGIAHLDSTEYTQALACFDRASEAIALTGDEELKLENISYRALAYIGLQALSEAERCVHDTLERLEAKVGLTYHLSHKVHFNLWHVLQAIGRSKQASEHLQRAYENVMAHAQEITEAGLRESFLQGDRTNQEIVTAWQAHKTS